jgi:hypothetical protein
MDQRQEVPVLKPAALFTERASRDKARLRAYNQLLEQIYNRVQTSAKVPGNTWIIYTVPPFVFGLPKIDLEDCVVYLVFQLRQAGYEVRYTYPNLLYISWKHHERNYILQDSPIMKAMLPPEPPAKSLAGARTGPGGKKLPKVQFNAPAMTGQLAIMGGMGQPQQQQQGQQQQQQGQPRSAGEYEPPNSFMNAISGGLGENPDRSAQNKTNVLNDLFKY